jgi:hypothetical protein
MIYDGLLQLTGTAGIPGSVDSPTTGTQTSTNTIDFGTTEDLGIGDDDAVKLSATVITSFTGGTSLQVNVQGSVDNVSFATLAFGPVIAEANLIVGTHLFDIDLPRIIGAGVNNPGASQGRIRYLRLQYITVGTHGAGSLFAGFLLDRHDHNVNYPSSHSTLFPAGT